MCVVCACVYVCGVCIVPGACVWCVCGVVCVVYGVVFGVRRSMCICAGLRIQCMHVYMCVGVCLCVRTHVGVKP